MSAMVWNGSTVGSAGEFGIASGLRSMAPPALLSQHLAERPMWQLDSQVERVLASPGVRALLGVAALGELVADKLPSARSRMAPRPLLARAIAGAVGGGVLMHRARQPALMGALAGAVGAVTGAAAGYHARQALTRSGIPDSAVAVLEDLLALAIARRAIYS
ncbi:MAG: DUF4126 family protein [Gemmatimonadetes bacterium]|nr:DUF4126 family protein [Gemmatimonadota bacterium]